MYKTIDPDINAILQTGTVIPAHPLALQNNLSLDIESQKQLTRYYILSGAGGVAVGVHTTQFEIRKPGINLYETTLKLAAETIEEVKGTTPFIKVAGICGPTDQAIKEAELAIKYGYHLGLLSMGGIPDYTEDDLIERAKAIAKLIPLFGFYLQPAVGGRLLSYEFWRALSEIPNLHAIKVAAFNRYQTLDVVRAVCDSSRRNEIALYTGNDDNIIADLLTPYRFLIGGQPFEKRFVGGLLGHWAVWTKRAVALLEEVKTCLSANYANVEKLLSKGVEVTDMNAVIFDAKNNFRGCISGIHEVLRRQGLIKGIWCLSDDEKLSPGQSGEIDRIVKNYSYLTDDEFVKTFLKESRKKIDS